MVRKVIRKNLPVGFKEGIQYGMISYFVPLKKKPDTYNGQPLTIVSLASQKNYMALYLLGIYALPDKRKSFEAAYAKSGKKLVMGKSCLRFKAVEELALDVLSESLTTITVEDWIEVHDKTHK